MARAKQAPSSTQRSMRSSGRKSQAPKEVEVVGIEAAEAPTQRIRSKRQPKPAKSSLRPKTSNGAAKKRAPRSVPREEPQEELEVEDEPK